MGVNCGSQVVLCEYPIRLDTYEGCSHDCRYCFARNKRDIAAVKPLHCVEQVKRSGVLRTGLGALGIQRLAVDAVTSLGSRAIRSIASA